MSGTSDIMRTLRENEERARRDADQALADRRMAEVDRQIELGAPEGAVMEKETRIDGDVFSRGYEIAGERKEISIQLYPNSTEVREVSGDYDHQKSWDLTVGDQTP